MKSLLTFCFIGINEYALWKNKVMIANCDTFIFNALIWHRKLVFSFYHTPTYIFNTMVSQSLGTMRGVQMENMSIWKQDPFNVFQPIYNKVQITYLALSIFPHGLSLAHSTISSLLFSHLFTVLQPH